VYFDYCITVDLN